MHALTSDLRHAARRLQQTPLYTLCAVTVLAIGIGLNASVFSLVDALLFRPPPFQDAERVVHVYQDSDSGAPTSTSFPAYRDMAAMRDVFSAVAATTATRAIWEREDEARNASVQFATASYLEVLGLTPHLGRWFSPQHDRVGAEKVAVLSYATWRSQMGADPTVLGRTVRLNNQLVTIIGVGPSEYNGDALVTDFWLSISSTPVGGPYQVANLERRSDHWYQVKARLAPDIAIGQARAAMRGLATRLAEAYPAYNEGRDITVFAQNEVRLHPLLDRSLLTGGVAVVIIAALILLLACSNLANLLLARGISRSAEIAVRAALGADRLRIVRLLLLESLLLSALGAAAGLGLAAWTTAVLSSVSLPDVGFSPGGGLDVGFDHRVVIFGVLMSIATGLLFGLVPAVRSMRTDVAAILQDEGRAQSAGRGISRLRKALVVVQVAISVVLVIAAGLLGRSLANAERVDPGVDTQRIAVIETDLAQGGVAQEESAAVAAQVLERVEALPGVERAALTTRLPARRGATTTQIVDGYTPPSGTSAVELELAMVSRGYFETMGIPLLAGRTFTAADRPQTPNVIVVNDAAARAYWGGNAVGGRIRSQGADGDWLEVVGVVADVKVTDLTEAPTPMIYGSTEQSGVGGFAVVARTSDNPAALLPSLRRALREVRESLPVIRLHTLEAHFGQTMAIPRVGTALMGGFSLLALLLAGLGIYAVVSFNVERRTQELGIRTALGATRSTMVRMVVGESLAAVGIGLVAGLALAALAARGLETMLFGVTPLDTMTFAGASALLLAAASLAAYLPARRAGSAHPAQVLRRS
jgi:putative ABC transport system permease protein